MERLTHDMRGTISQIGLIGCGRMGRQMVAHMSQSGWAVHVSDASPEALKSAAALGGVPSSTTELSLNGGLIFLVVVDEEQVWDVLTGKDGVFEHAPPGTIVAICASVHPSVCRQVAELGLGRGITVIDVALVGGERGAEQANTTLFCGGKVADIRVCEAVFSAFATTVVHVGEVGAGQVAKTANNVLMWAALRADYEVLSLAKAYGVSPGSLRAALRVGTGANRPLDEWGSHRLRWPGKDLEVAVRMALDAGVRAPLIDSLGQLMADLDVRDLHRLR